MMKEFMFVASIPLILSAYIVTVKVNNLLLTYSHILSHSWMTITHTKNKTNKYTPQHKELHTMRYVRSDTQILKCKQTGGKKNGLLNNAIWIDVDDVMMWQACLIFIEPFIYNRTQTHFNSQNRLDYVYGSVSYCICNKNKNKCK